jgi:hypothetical protein
MHLHANLIMPQSENKGKENVNKKDKEMLEKRLTLVYTYGKLILA